MGTAENAELMRAGYEAFAKGDMDAVRELMSPDIAWHIGGRSDLAGDYHGVDEVFGFFGQIFERSGGSFANEVHDILASDDHVVVLVHETGHRGDRTLDADAVHVWHLKDGKSTEFWAAEHDAYAADAFWG